MRRLIDSLAGTPEKRIALLLLCLGAMIYIPLAGNYAFWDPWEPHYGEVARQMAQRNDWISLWWPGSPLDRMEFWSKPALTPWLMALSMKLFGLEWSHVLPNEMVHDWRPEWACRLPEILLALAVFYAIWITVSRLASRRAGILATLVLATSPQWALITRQAVTDIPFVAPMTIALCFAALALLSPAEVSETELSRQQVRIGKWTFSYPEAGAWRLFVALFTLTTLPQLIVISVQLKMYGTIGGYHFFTIGLVPMLPYFAAFFGGLWWCARATTRRELYLFSAYVFCALATLAKGPAGIAMPALVLLFYLVVTGRWRDIWTKLEIPRGLVIFIATAFPWYHAMLIRHGMPYWNEFIGDNYIHRAEGRHGDRGTFEYYLQYIGYGMFPWSGLTTLGTALGFAKLRGKSPRAQLCAFALVWFLVDFTTVALVNTKFHHYILPALPALAVVTGLFLDELLRAPSRGAIWGVGLVAAPLTFWCGRDLAAFPPRVLWLFNYDYVNMPGTGRPWPAGPQFGDRYQYGPQLMIFALLATAAVAALIWAVARHRRETEEETPAPVDALPAGRFSAWALGLVTCGLAAGIASGPATPHGAAPVIGRLAWVAPTLLMVVAFVLLARLLHRPGRRRELGVWILGGLAVAWTGFVLDKMIVELGPHWGQKHVIAAYYNQRKGPEEPLIAWQLYWRGETFYTRNEIYDPAKRPSEKTVFLGDRNVERLQTYLKTHRGRRVFFVVERTRLAALRNLLPEDARASLHVVNDSNDKLYLAVAELPRLSVGTGAQSLEHQVQKSGH